MTCVSDEPKKPEAKTQPFTCSARGCDKIAVHHWSPPGDPGDENCCIHFCEEHRDDFLWGMGGPLPPKPGVFC
jgi:hypothetical protein